MVHPITYHEVIEEEQTYSTALSLTSTIGDSGWLAPVSLPPGMTLFSLYRRLAEPQGRSGLVWNILPPPGFDPGLPGLTSP